MEKWTKIALLALAIGGGYFLWRKREEEALAGKVQVTVPPEQLAPVMTGIKATLPEAKVEPTSSQTIEVSLPPLKKTEEATAILQEKLPEAKVTVTSPTPADLIGKPVSVSAPEMPEVAYVDGVAVTPTFEAPEPSPIPQEPPPVTPDRKQIYASSVQSVLTYQQLIKIEDPEERLRATMAALWAGTLTIGSGWAPYQVAQHVVEIMLSKLPPEYKKKYFQERLAIYRQGAIATNDRRYIEHNKKWFEIALAEHKKRGIEIPIVISIGTSPMVRYEKEIMAEMEALAGIDWSKIRLNI